MSGSNSDWLERDREKENFILWTISPRVMLHWGRVSNFFIIGRLPLRARLSMQSTAMQ
jgi:hypothetical protein